MRKLFYFSLTAMALVLLGTACKKQGGHSSTDPEDNSRVVTTQAATEITQHSAILSALLYWEEGLAAPTGGYFLLIEKSLVDRGDAQFPSVQQMIAGGAQTIEALGGFSGAGEEHLFSADATGLTAGTLYFYCPAAKFGEKVIYGEVRSFNTLPPTLNGLAASNETATSMTIRFRYDGSDVESVSLKYTEAAGSPQETTEYTLADHVYTFQLTGLNPNSKYTIVPTIRTTGGYTLSESISASTQKGIVLLSATSLSSTSVRVRVRLWYNAAVPTLYYSHDPYRMTSDYTSASHVTMYRVAEQGMPSDYGRDFTVDLVNLASATKYYFLVALNEVKMEINSFTTT